MARHPISALRPLLAGLCLSALAAGCASAPPAPPPGTPRLILFLVVDQGRYDYLERFRPLFSAGLARLLDESVVFTRALHDHAITTTAPGHATLATGVHPARHGIVDNWWYDRASGERILAVGDPPSPAALLAPTLGDWLKAAYPGARVFAAGGKDRAAILTAGKRADAAFWTDADDGRFTTSDYYRGRQRRWLAAYHSDLFPDRHFGRAWEPLPEVVEHAAAYGVEPVDRGLIDNQFPHRIGSLSPSPDAPFYDDFLNDTPFGDAYLADFARALIDGEGLGRDATPDFLGLAFSATDKIGHGYGPDSPELLDTLLRLDRALGELLAFVDQRVGLEHTIVSLSADHGVVALPEVLAGRGAAAARRFGTGDVLCFQRAHRALAARFGAGRWFRRGFFLDREGVAAAGVAAQEIEDETRRLIEGCPGVARAWTRSELEAGGGGGDPMHRLYANSFHPLRSPDLLVQLAADTLPPMSAATSHGSPYLYDRHVPWLLRLPSGRGATVGEAVHTVDVAPTVARLASLTPPPGLDGVDRGPLLSSE